MNPLVILAVAAICIYGAYRVIRGAEARLRAKLARRADDADPAPADLVFDPGSGTYRPAPPPPEKP